MKRTLVIGDIHGGFKALKQVLERANVTENDKLIFLGNIIGLGIYLLSRLQNNDPKLITEIMNDSGLVYHPFSMNIKKTDLVDSLLNLKNFVKSKNTLWYTVIDDSHIDLEWINKNISGLKFD